MESMRISNLTKYMDVSRSTIWRYVRDGKLTPIKLSDGVTVFLKDDVDQFIMERIK